MKITTNSTSRSATSSTQANALTISKSKPVTLSLADLLTKAVVSPTRAISKHQMHKSKASKVVLGLPPPNFKDKKSQVQRLNSVHLI
jgi:hypothetical protein